MAHNKKNARTKESKHSIGLFTPPCKFLGLLYLLLASSISLASSMDVFDNDIQLHLTDDEFQLLTLNKGDTTIDIPVIKFSSQQAMTKGTIVLVADLQVQQTASNNFYKLAKTLPNWGWNTILVTPKNNYFVLPTKPKVPVQSNQQQSQEATKDDTNPEETSTNAVATEEALNDKAIVSPEANKQTGLKAIALQHPELGYSKKQYTTFIGLLLSKINTTFLQQPGYQILMVEGKTASVAINLLNTELAPEINGLVLNNPYWPELTSNQALPKQLANLQLPVLDLISTSANNWAIQTQSERVAQTRIMVKPFYRQREVLGGQLNSLSTEHLAKEIVGWTRYLGW